MNLVYTIDQNSYNVNIYISGNNIPIINQPNWPNGESWSSYNEADQWAQLCIMSIRQPDAPYAPAGPGLSGEPKSL